jgi:hypothetical protein
VNADDFDAIAAIFSPMPVVSTDEQKRALDLLKDEVSGWVNVSSAQKFTIKLFDILIDQSGKSSSQPMINIVPNKVVELMSHLQSNVVDRFKFAMTVVAALIIEANDEEFDIWDGYDQHAFVDWALPQYIAAYQSWKVFKLATSGESAQRLDNARREQIAKISEGNRIVEQGAQLATNFEQRVADLEARTTAAINRAAESSEIIETRKIETIAALEKLQKDTETSADNLEAFRLAITLDERLKDVEQLWKLRARWNAVGFAISLLFLVGALGGVPILSFIYADRLLDLLSKLNKWILTDLCGSAAVDKCTPSVAQIAVASLDRIVLMVAPALLVIWLLRIIVRYNIHALVMGNDAHQRSIMINTFIYLADKSVVKKEDKTELLSAIFRPPPGTSNDGIEMPNVIEVVDKLKP